MSEINSIANGTYTIGETNNLTFQAAPGISITEPSAGTVRIGNDETVLFERTTGSGLSGTLSEPCLNFDLIKVHFRNLSHGDDVRFFHPVDTPPHPVWFNTTRGNNALNQDYVKVIFYGNYWSATNAKSLEYNITGTSAPTITNNKNEAYGYLYKVVGINRISGGNA